MMRWQGVFFVCAAALATSLSSTARADETTDVAPDIAERVRSGVKPGAIVVNYCWQCGGLGVKVLHVRDLAVVPGTFAADEGRRSILVERDVLFSSPTGEFSPDKEPPKTVVLKPGTCGAKRDDWTDDNGSQDVSRREILPLHYSFLLDEQTGALRWMGELSEPGAPNGIPPAPALTAEQVGLIRDCALLAKKNGLPTKLPKEETPFPTSLPPPSTKAKTGSSSSPSSTPTSTPTPTPH